MSFKKGQSGNPGGRPKVLGDVRDLARSHTEAAVKTLHAVMKNGRAPAAARVAAATAILDRAWGRPTQTINANIKRDIVEMTDAELFAFLSDTEGRSGGTAEAQISQGESDCVH